MLTGPGGEESLLLAEPDYGEAAAFLPAPGAYRALLDPTTPLTPGAGPRELLGHGDRDGLRDVTVVTEPADPAPKRKLPANQRHIGRFCKLFP